MNEAIKYLQECGTFYLATAEGDQPHVRPFGAVCEFEEKLYIVTNNKKDVYNQMKLNNRFPVCRASIVRQTGHLLLNRRDRRDHKRKDHW